ncbi:MAG: hypothetical protein PHV34_12240 [Verrucomicrobiae bacterium]|nr:hypothetical protein [Verrucomicrobiae bacterium]
MKIKLSFSNFRLKRAWRFWLYFLPAIVSWAAESPEFISNRIKLEGVDPIWSDGYHNAFTTLAKWDNEYFCAFRHGPFHDMRFGCKGGEIFVIRSADLKKWDFAQSIKLPVKDPRDPQFFRFKNRLGLLIPCAGGKQWLDNYICWFDRTKPQPFAEQIRIDIGNKRIWKIIPNQDLLYASVHARPKDQWEVSLYESKDALEFEPKHTFNINGKNIDGNEADLLFLNNGQCVGVIRREKQPAILVKSNFPYAAWLGSELNREIHSPNLFQYKGEIFCACRILDPAKMAILSIDLDKMKLHVEIILPSGGDCAQPGVLLEDDQLLVSYYSQHDQPKKNENARAAAGIYLARLRLPK